MAKILIVEDEKPIRNLIKRNLELMGHICMEASDGDEAAEIIMENPFEPGQTVVAVPVLCWAECWKVR